MSYVRQAVQTVGNTTQFISRFDPMQPIVVRAGETVQVNLTGMLEYAVAPVESGQFMPYERALYANYSNFSYPVAGSVIEESGSML